MEVTALGIPNLTVPIDNHPEQIKNSINIEKYGISRVKEIKNLDALKISEDINYLLNSGEIQERVQKVQDEFSDYTGIDNAIKIILDCHKT